jgi:hypothetical protein
MFRFTMIGLLSLLLVGCTTERTASVSTPFMGTWFQRSSLDADQPAGFISLSAQQVTFNVDSLPRGVMAITTNETDPSLRSGRIVGVDGSTIFLSLGEALIDQQTDDVRLLSTAVHLDVYYFAPGAAATGKPQLTLRLWPSAALATTSYARQLKTSEWSSNRPRVDNELNKAVLIPASLPSDQRFMDASDHFKDPSLGAFTQQLIRAKTAGHSPQKINELYLRNIRNSRSDIVSDLDQARRGDGQALKRADEHLTALTDYAVVYRHWYNGL